MAGLSDSNRDLWQFIAGHAVFRPKNLIENELKRNKNKILSALEFYKIPRSPAGEQLKSIKSLQGVQLEFVQRLSVFLSLEEEQSYDLYCSFLLRDYRGSKKELQTVLASDRYCQTLMLKVQEFYNAERLYLLQTLKHLLSLWDESKHPYATVYEEFVRPLYESTDFINNIIKQYDTLCSSPAPQSNMMAHPAHERQPVLWYVQNLREQCELLEIILLYYRSADFPPSSLLDRLLCFKKQGFGRRQTNKHLLDETSEHLVRRIGFLQVLIILVGMDLEEVQEKQLVDDLAGIPLLHSSEFSKLSAVMQSLDDSPEHGPLLLAWSIFRQISADPKGGIWARKLGNKALELDVFKNLSNQLSSEPFCGKTIVASTCHCVVYGLLCCVLSLYHEDTLGDSEGLYSVVAILLKQPFLAHELWARGLKDGLGNLLSSSASRFPFDYKHCMDLCVSLTQASTESARHTVHFLQSLPIYTEFMEKSTEVTVTSEQSVWQLAKDRVPYAGCDFVVPAGVFGQMHPQSDSNNIMQWEWRYSAFNVLLGETHRLATQILQGAGMVNSLTVERVASACQLCAALMSVEVPDIPQISSLVSMIYNLIQRLCQISCPPLELLAACLQVLTRQVSQQPLEVWHNLKLTGLLPFLTENIDNYAEAASGAGLNIAAYGSLLAGAECSQGKYPVTLALLDLIAALVQPLHKEGLLDELMAYMIFIGREVYPSFHKWRYQGINTREHIGQKCLEIFHQILNILTSVNKNGKPSVRDVCVYTLLYTESGRTLLNIIGTGVDTIEKAIASQGSSQEGFGVELIHSVRLAISVLNRLLLLRPPNLPTSPMEESLSAQPANRTTRHIVATIMQYMFHHHDPRLPSMATLLLKRLAMLFPMSMLACLGSEAEPLRDVYLARLEASTEDVELKVRMLQLLSVCVEMQPGLIEIFLNIKMGSDEKSVLSFGKSSCLLSVLDLISVKKQKGNLCPSILLSAVLDFLYALWKGRRETALSVLREKEEFWPSICLSLTRNLEEPGGSDVSHDLQIMATEIHSIAHIMRIVALEVYHIRSDALSAGLKSVLLDLCTKGRFEYWSNYLSLCLKHLPSSASTSDPTEDPSLSLMLAWRDLMLVLTILKGSGLVTLSDPCKDTLLTNLLDGIRSLFTASDLSPLQVKLASVASACYLTLLKSWISAVSKYSSVLELLEQILSQTCSNSEVLVPSVQIGLIASLTLVLQHVREQKKHVDSFQLTSLLAVVCGVIQQSTYQLPRPLQSSTTPTPSKVPNVQDDKEKDFDVKIKLQCVAVCLLEELISLMQSSDWLQTLKQHCTVQTLLHSLPTWLQVRQGFSYVQATFNLFLTIAQCPEGAELLSCSGLTQQLCVVSMETYNQPTNGGEARPKDAEQEWKGIHGAHLHLFASMLSALKYNFLEDAFNFVGVHCERLHQCLDSVGVSLSEGILQEAVPTCAFLAQLSQFPREWRLHMLDTMNTLMLDVCILTNRCVSLLIRPTLLQHMVEKQSRGDTSLNITQDKLKVTPLLKRLSSQSSSNEESEGFSHSVLQIQNRLLQILSHTLTALRNFSPDFCEILLDQNVDISECESFLRLGFSAPSVEADSAPSFGTLLSCLNMGLKLLPKAESKAGVSPVKSADQEPHPFKKALLLQVMEGCWVLIMCQAVRYLREPGFHTREKQLLKRELSAELTSFQMSLNRHIRRGPGSPAQGSSVSPQPGSASKLQFQSSASISTHHDLSFFRTLDIFIRQVLR